MGRHLTAWLATFALDMVAVPALAYLFGNAGTALGMLGGGVALTGVAVAAVADGAVGGLALALLVPVSLAGPAGVVTTAEVAAERPVASIVRGDDSGAGTTLPLTDRSPREDGVGIPGEASPCADPVIGECPATVTPGPDDGSPGVPAPGGSEPAVTDPDGVELDGAEPGVPDPSGARGGGVEEGAGGGAEDGVPQEDVP